MGGAAWNNCLAAPPLLSVG